MAGWIESCQNAMETTMQRTALAIMLAAAVALPGLAYAGPDLSRALPHQAIQLAQGGGFGGGGFGPGSGTGTGGGVGADGEIRCRTVVVPGSGRGPQEVCERVVQQCRTVVVPGSGRGPQEVCERVVQRCRTVVVPGSGRGPQQVCN